MDIYDEEVEKLTNNPALIKESWNNYHPLFRTVDDCGFGPYGCLTQIKCGDKSASSQDLTERIRSDVRVPMKPEDIKVEDLEVFAEWQRIIDNELNRKARQNAS
jgi:hypothetical protein